MCHYLVAVQLYLSVLSVSAVDWASLAKQWIAQREVMGMTSSDPAAAQYMCQQPQAPQSHIPAAPPPPPPPPQPSDDDVPAAPGDVPATAAAAGQQEGEAGIDTSTAHVHGTSPNRCQNVS